MYGAVRKFCQIYSMAAKYRNRGCIMMYGAVRKFCQIYSMAAKYRNRGNNDCRSHTQPTCCAYRVEVKASVSPKQYGALLLLLVTAYFYIVLPSF